MSEFKHKKLPPSTIVGEEGSAKRNYLRRSHFKHRKMNASNSSTEVYIEEEFEITDPNDPDFVEEEIDFDVSISSITLPNFKKIITPIIAEFFNHGDSAEVIDRVAEMDCPEYNYELVKRMINMSLDRSDRERELASCFLSDAYSEILTSAMISKGFLRLFEVADDIEMDVPGAHEMLSKFLARAVVDEVLPPAFITDSASVNLGGEIVEHARLLLSLEHAAVSLESCWGPGDGRSVRAMKKSVDLLLSEFLSSTDYVEAMRCVKELNSPHFHHEIVRKAVISCLDASEEAMGRMSSLLKYLVNNEVISSTQAAQGFDRLYGSLSDLKLDTPSAPAIVNKFRDQAIADQVIASDYAPSVNKE